MWFNDPPCPVVTFGVGHPESDSGLSRISSVDGAAEIGVGSDSPDRDVAAISTKFNPASVLVRFGF